MPDTLPSRRGDGAPSPLQRLALCAGLALMLAATAQAADFAIEASLVAAGGGHSRSAGGCLAIDASIGQHTVGESAGGAFSVRAGFWPALADDATDSLFHNAFEECQ
jgi:hypothetical protein